MGGKVLLKVEFFFLSLLLEFCLWVLVFSAGGVKKKPAYVLVHRQVDHEDQLAENLLGQLTPLIENVLAWLPYLLFASAFVWGCWLVTFDSTCWLLRRERRTFWPVRSPPRPGRRRGGGCPKPSGTLPASCQLETGDFFHYILAMWEKNVSLSKRLFFRQSSLIRYRSVSPKFALFLYISSESFQAFQTQFTDVCVGKSFETLTRKSFDRMWRKKICLQPNCIFFAGILYVGSFWRKITINVGHFLKA